jgi:hypothetical protein
MADGQPPSARQGAIWVDRELRQDSSERPPQPQREVIADDGEEVDPIDGREAVTVAEFPRLAGIKRTRTQELSNAGLVRAMLIGGRTLIAADSARQFMAGCQAVYS